MQCYILKVTVTHSVQFVSKIDFKAISYNYPKHFGGERAEKPRRKELRWEKTVCAAHLQASRLRRNWVIVPMNLSVSDSHVH